MAEKPQGFEALHRYLGILAAGTIIFSITFYEKFVISVPKSVNLLFNSWICLLVSLTLNLIGYLVYTLFKEKSYLEASLAGYKDMELDEAVKQVFRKSRPLIFWWILLFVLVILFLLLGFVFLIFFAKFNLKISLTV